MPDIPPTDLRRIQEFADTVFPGHQGGELVLWLPGRANAVFPVRVYLADHGEADADALSEIEQAAVDGLRGLEQGRKVTGEELADIAEYPFNGRFREALAGLVRRGVMKNHRPGYSL